MLKYHGVSRAYESYYYTHCKKHFCPNCNNLLEVIKVSKIVNSKDPESVKFDFRLGDGYMIGNVKCIWDEFKCPACSYQISVRDFRKAEYEQKRKARQERKRGQR